MSARDDRVLAWQRNELLWATIARFWSLARRYWFVSTPLAAGAVFGRYALIFAALICAYLFKKMKDRLAVEVQALFGAAGGEDNYREMQRLASIWPDIARACGLDQKPQVKPLGIRAAASRALNSVEHALAEQAYGGQESVVPSIDTIAATSLGFRLDIVMLAGQTVDNYRKASDALANAFQVAEVRVSQPRPKVVSLTPVVSDPLMDGIGLTPDTLVPAADLEWVPMGRDENGETWSVPLNQTSSVFGGVPGAGKSVAINVFLANLSHREDLQIIGMDMKGGLELGDWADRCSATAFDQEKAVEVFAQLMDLHKSRMLMLRSKGFASMNNLGYSKERPLYLVVIDEAAELFTPETNSKEAKQVAADCLSYVSRIVRLCRATGIVVLLATQKPTTDSLPSIIRDNAGFKVAFRCTTPEQAVAILGDGVRLADFSPTAIKKNEKGVAVAVDADGALRRVRAFYITEQSRREVVRRTAHLARPIEMPSSEPYWNQDDPDDGPDLVLPVRWPRSSDVPTADILGGLFGPLGDIEVQPHWTPDPT